MKRFFRQKVITPVTEKIRIFKQYPMEMIPPIVKGIILLVVPILAFRLLIWSQFRNDSELVADFVYRFAGPAVLNVVFLYIISFLFVAVIGNLVIGETVFLAAINILSFINYQKVVARNVPLYISDIAFANNVHSLTKMVSLDELHEVILSTLFIILAGVSIELLLRYFFPQEKKGPFKSRLPKRLIAIGTMLLLFCGTLTISNPDSLLTKTLAKVFHVELVYADWNQPLFYQYNGFVVASLYNMNQKSHIETPENYSQATIETIVEKYKTLNDTEAVSSAKPNIIYILSESFTDPAKYQEEFVTSEDPIPFTHQIMNESSYSGQALVLDYGGGTANMEFELNTSFSNFYLDQIPYQFLLPKKKEFPSMASYLDTLGYYTFGIHDDNGATYRRNEDYPIMGYQSFVDFYEMKNFVKKEAMPFLSDESLFKEVLDIMKQHTDTPIFTTAITMQNHQPYDADYFENPIQVESDLLDEEGQAQMETYLTGLHYSDEALELLINELNQLERETIVVFFGDHYPGSGVYETVFDGELANYTTPLFIYSTKQELNNTQKNWHTLSLNFVSSEVLKVAGMRSSPFYCLMHQLSGEITGLTENYILDGEGNVIEDFDEANYPTLQEYHLIEYDVTYGKNYAKALGFFN